MTDSAPLDGTRTVVTGASSGIGRATARLFADRGASVAVAARRAGRLETLAGEIESDSPGDALVVPTDVTEPAQVESLVSETVDAFGGLDVVVSNAGTLPADSIDEISIDEYRQFMGVNVDGTALLTKFALPHVRKTRGNLVYVGSFAGKLPFPRSPLYAGSKWWIRGFASSLQGAEGMDGVAVSVVNPGEVRTEIGQRSRGESNVGRYEPGEVTEPEEVADAIAFAAKQHPPNTVTELDLMRRTKYDNLRSRSSFPE